MQRLNYLNGEGGRHLLIEVALLGHQRPTAELELTSAVGAVTASLVPSTKGGSLTVTLVGLL